VLAVNPSEYALYRSFRPTLAIDRTLPGVGPLDADFALHPVMKDGLHRLWLAGEVAVMPNVGYPDASRSHFDGQLFMDRGTPGEKTTADGWLNRYLQSAMPSSDPLRAVAFGSSLPASLEGPSPALAMSDLAALAVGDDPARNRKFLDLERRAYAEASGGRPWDAEVTRTGASLLDAIQALEGSALPAPSVAYPPGKFGGSMRQLAQLLRSGLFAIELAQVDLPGWDTHGKQQTDVMNGTFPGLLRELSDGIAALVDDLGAARMQDVLVLTASEFGRTARENGSLGTDHGSGFASFAVGGAVRGGVHFGPAGWHGLANLRDGRDLQHSLDFRDVFGEALLKHMGALDPRVFPGFTPTPVGFL